MRIQQAGMVTLEQSTTTPGHCSKINSARILPNPYLLNISNLPIPLDAIISTELINKLTYMYLGRPCTVHRRVNESVPLLPTHS
jgi:hypothetical protein